MIKSFLRDYTKFIPRQIQGIQIWRIFDGHEAEEGDLVFSKTDHLEGPGRGAEGVGVDELEGVVRHVEDRHLQRGEDGQVQRPSHGGPRQRERVYISCEEVRPGDDVPELLRGDDGVWAGDVHSLGQTATVCRARARLEETESDRTSGNVLVS